MKIHLITNCTNLKKSNIQGKVTLESLIREHNSQSIVSAWFEHLENAVQKVPANEVYAGDHWKVATSIVVPNLDLWVLSAGYGLIHSSSHIGSYDATFSSGSENSINKTGLSNNEWWESLHQVRNSENFKCQSLHSLVSINVDDVFFIAASPDYLRVIQKELKQLLLDKKLTNKNLFIISSKHNIDKILMPYFLESSADFCSTLKGGRVSLNIRLARYLLEQDSVKKFSPNHIIDKYNHLQKTSVKLPVKNRKKLSDDEINNFIIKELEVNQGFKVSATMLLKKLRSINLACEQKRFTKLLNKIQLQ
ncbi:hypothetical protein [Colwellia psychrerythraea]|uniref:Uncharacterized protein n=1 Tax=Colwellia psychrerythraea (strain 34H / ATCC BAA-681) TaxID=167879 RepID=Q47ZY5_COLP3|nr:hypothetical protein [Colwellia psychrerythraea]AAZ28749.1 hypothetical protein CPS_2934 [Colwellia psychrerythraea 34H]